MTRVYNCFCQFVFSYSAPREILPPYHRTFPQVSTILWTTLGAMTSQSMFPLHHAHHVVVSIILWAEAAGNRCVSEHPPYGIPFTARKQMGVLFPEKKCYNNGS